MAAPDGEDYEDRRPIEWRKLGIGGLVLLIVVAIGYFAFGRSSGDDGVGSSDDFENVVVREVLIEGCGISPDADYIITDASYLQENEIINGPEGDDWIVQADFPSLGVSAGAVVLRLDNGSFGDRVYDINCPFDN